MNEIKESIKVEESGGNFKVLRTIEENVTANELLKIVEEIRKGLDAQEKTKKECEVSIATLTERLSAFENYLAKAKELELKEERK